MIPAGVILVTLGIEALEVLRMSLGSDFAYFGVLGLESYPPDHDQYQRNTVLLGKSENE